MNILPDAAIMQKTAGMMQALSHELRLQICALLRDGEMSVSGICEKLNMPQHKISQQLAILRTAGVLQSRKQSRLVFYGISDTRVTAIINILLEDQQSAEVSAETGRRPAFEAGRFAEMLKKA